MQPASCRTAEPKSATRTSTATAVRTVVLAAPEPQAAEAGRLVPPSTRDRLEASFAPKLEDVEAESARRDENADELAAEIAVEHDAQAPAVAEAEPVNVEPEPVAPTTRERIVQRAASSEVHESVPAPAPAAQWDPEPELEVEPGEETASLVVELDTEKQRRAVRVTRAEPDGDATSDGSEPAAVPDNIVPLRPRPERTKAATDTDAPAAEVAEVARGPPARVEPTLSLTPIVQAKLAVSSPGDALEREADAVAARVVCGTAPAPLSHGRPADRLQRALPHARAPPTAGPPASALPRSVASVVSAPGGGTALDATVRARIEPHVGVDLTAVRVRRDPAAAAAARDLNARAFTSGSTIFLAAETSPGDLRLMAHEAAHVAQQQTNAAARTTLMRDVSVTDLIPDWILDGVRSAIRAIPGYTLLTYIVGRDPLTDEPVPATPQELIETLLTYGPFGPAVGAVLQTIEVLGDIFSFVSESFAAHGLTLSRISSDIDAAWDELSVTNGIAGNVAIVRRYVDAFLGDVRGFVLSIVERVLEIVRSVVAEVAEPLLQTPEIAPVWNLAKKVIHYDPLRGVSVEAPTVEIIADFLRLIGEEERLAQMEERGTLQQTADWLDTQLAIFLSLIAELGMLFSDAWAAIQPENLPDLFTNLEALAQRAFGFVLRVAEFGATLILKVLELIKNALLEWLSEHAHTVPGFHLLTVILGQNPFTGETVPRTAENLIKGFITLMPGGEETYNQLAESGVISDAASRIEGEMARLGISLEMITGIFRGIWDTLSLDDLLDPIGAFVRVLDLFGEPLSRLIEFVVVVIEVVVTLVLRLMNFPSDLVGSIIANAIQAIEDIKRDPVAFFKNMLAAVKQGLSAFFDNILSYLIQGLQAWLFRGLGQLGITIPPDLTLASILELVLQVLGITAEALWTKLGEHIGPERVAMIRGALDRLAGAWQFIKDVQEGGIGAVWRYVTDQLSGLWNTLLDMAKDWIMTQIVQRVTARLLSMLDPTGIMAVVNSFIAFFAAVQSAIEYLRDILEIINRYVSTLAAVAAGNIAPGAQMLEQGLAAAIPVAIGFLANQVGLGNVPEKVVELIQRLRELVNQALDWLIGQAIRLGQAALNALGLGPEEAPAEPEPETGDAPITADTIPPDLPPDEVKRLILDMVRGHLVGAAKTSIVGVHGVVDAIANANRDRGLASLRVHVTDPESMAVRVEAAASSPQGLSISWAEIFAPSVLNSNEELEEWRRSLARASQASYAAVAVDGQPIGSLSSSGEGLHAEEGLVRSGDWTQAIAAAKSGATANGRSQVTLMINRTPCVSCVQWLSGAVAQARGELASDASRVTFVLAATGTYRRQARLSPDDLEALKAGSARIAERTGRPFDEVFKEQEEFWKEDLRSQSTEWTEGDEVYSGLGDLSAAGWRVMGLDAGQTVTPRQVELRRIAAELAADMEHSA